MLNIPINKKPNKEGYIKDYKILDTLGSGIEGTVYKAKLKNRFYTVKSIPTPLSFYSINDLNNEIKVMSRLNGITPKIAPHLYETFLSNDFKNVYMVMDYVNCGTLHKWKLEHHVTKEDLKKIEKLVDILHDNDILHRDLHDDNILVNCIGKINIISGYQILENPILLIMKNY